MFTKHNNKTRSNQSQARCNQPPIESVSNARCNQPPLAEGSNTRCNHPPLAQRVEIAKQFRGGGIDNQKFIFSKKTSICQKFTP